MRESEGPEKEKKNAHGLRHQLNPRPLSVVSMKPQLRVLVASRAKMVDETPSLGGSLAVAVVEMGMMVQMMESSEKQPLGVRFADSMLTRALLLEQGRQVTLQRTSHFGRMGLDKAARAGGTVRTDHRRPDGVEGLVGLIDVGFEQDPV